MNNLFKLLCEEHHLNVLVVSLFHLILTRDRCQNLQLDFLLQMLILQLLILLHRVRMVEGHFMVKQNLMQQLVHLKEKAMQVMLVRFKEKAISVMLVRNYRGQVTLNSKALLVEYYSMLKNYQDLVLKFLLFDWKQNFNIKLNFMDHMD